MEHLQCALLGFFGDVIGEQGVDTSLPDAPFTHPSEVALITAALPMARDYEALSAYRDRSSTGRSRGFYANALALAVGDVMQSYEADVLGITDAGGLLAIRSRYALAFRKAVVMAQTTDVEERLRQLSAFCVEPRLPLQLRVAVGNRVGGALLRNVAHWVAHGEVLDPSDFFVMPSDEKAEDGSMRQWAADRTRVPPGWSDALLAHIVVAGKERRILLREGGANDLLDRRAMSDADRARERDDTAAVFGRLCDSSLIDGGSVVLDELERRVRAAHAHWSKIIWTSVKQRFRLAEQLDAVRDMYLCRRGDVWHTFVASAGHMLFSKPYQEDPQAVAGRLAQDQRAVAVAFRGAMQASGLADNVLYKSFAMSYRELPASSSSAGGGGAGDVTFAPGHPLTLDAIGALTLGNVRRLALQFRLPPGMALIVSPNAQRRYVRIFALHIALKLALFGLDETRRFAGLVSRSYRTSPLLRKLLHLTAVLHFFLSNVAFCLQVDVQDAQFKHLASALEETTSAEGARRAHELFMDELYGGAFLLQDGVDVARSIDAAMILALGLYVVVQRDTTQAVIKASAGTERGHGTMVHAEHEVSRTLEYVSMQLQRRVLATVAPTIAMDTRPSHRALWTRMDLNRWMSGEAAAIAETLRRQTEERQRAEADRNPPQISPPPTQRRDRAHAQQPPRHSGTEADSTDLAELRRRQAEASRRTASGGTSTVRGISAAVSASPAPAHQPPQISSRLSSLIGQRHHDAAAAPSSSASRASSGAAEATSGLVRPSSVLSASAAAALQARREARNRVSGQPASERPSQGYHSDDPDVAEV